MKNIGSVTNKWLENAGIDTVEELRQIGVVPVYCLIKKMESSVSLNLLWGLEGAAENIDYREITERRKDELKLELETFIQNNPEWQ